MQVAYAAPSRALRGRLADVFLPALVAGSLDALVHRLGDAASVDDPVLGRATSLADVTRLLDDLAARFRSRGLAYLHRGSVTGIDRDASEGRLVDGSGRELPVVVVAERRRARRIDVRLYGASGEPLRIVRPPHVPADDDLVLPPVLRTLVEALGRGATSAALEAFEPDGRVVDALGGTHERSSGALASWLEASGGSRIAPVGVADDGGSGCLEALVRAPATARRPERAAFGFTRGEGGRLAELRVYAEP